MILENGTPHCRTKLLLNTDFNWNNLLVPGGEDDEGDTQQRKKIVANNRNENKWDDPLSAYYRLQSSWWI